jgi:Kef-type K+ transport system membrane component KefB
MSAETLLVHLLIVFVAARVAAEVAERIGQPAVLLEILVGIAIGPSLLGLIHSDEFLRSLGELGAILLLFEVGLQMNLRELTRVGGDSLRVAVIGIAVPMLVAIPALRATGIAPTTALFIAAGITATSVGITARVFGDLRSLATPEARIVLGAAVADDVGGLLILTFVVALASGGAVSTSALVSTLGVALGFVIVVSALAIWLAPRALSLIDRRSRADGTLMVLALAFALLVAWGAAAARLAPIVGAFIAGLAVSQAEVRDDIHRRISPIVQVMVPIFFLLIGVDTELDVFSNREVVVVAGLLTAIAVAGKVVAGVGVRKGRAQRLLVGVAMIPRGEVGLIFAGLGLANGILNPGYYAMLVVVVLATTLVTPPMMRQLIVRSRRRARAPAVAGSEQPGEWLVVTDDDVQLAAAPPDFLALPLALEAAILCASREPGARLLAWLSNADPGPPIWNSSMRETFFRLLRSGNVRSWRLLEVTGILAKCLPIVEAAISRRKRDSFNLDPEADLRFDLLDELRTLLTRHPPGAERLSDTWEGLRIKDQVYLAALCRDAFANEADPASIAAAFAESIGLVSADVDTIRFVVSQRHLLPAAARRIDMAGEDAVLELAAHIGSVERADALYLLAVAEDAMEPWQREMLDTQFELVRTALAHPDTAAAGDLVEARRAQIAEALARILPQAAIRGLDAAPRRYLVAHAPEVVARHMKMTEIPIGRFEVRLEAEPVVPGGDRWVLHVAVRDRHSLLAHIAWALSMHDVAVEEAYASTWRDGKAIDVFRVKASPHADWEAVRQSITDALVHGPNGAHTSPVEGSLQLDNIASPWYTIVEIRAYDRTGLLHRVAAALANAGLRIHTALVATVDGVAVDVFHVTGAEGSKLDDEGERALRQALAGAAPRRWFPRRRSADVEVS